MASLQVESAAALEIGGLSLSVRGLGVQLAQRPDLGRVVVGASMGDQHVHMEVRPLAQSRLQGWSNLTRELAVVECRGLRWDVSATLGHVALQNLMCGVTLSVWDKGAPDGAPAVAVASLHLTRELAFERGLLLEGCPVMPPAAGGAPVATLPAATVYGFDDAKVPWGRPQALAPYADGLFWIWASDRRFYDASTRQVRGAPMLQRTVQSPTATTATLWSSADDEHEVWLNGQSVARSVRRAPDVTVSRNLALREGRNELWVRVRNFEDWGHGGFCAVLVPDLPGIPVVRTDATWRTW